MLPLTPLLFLQAVARDTVLTRVVQTELSTLEKVLAYAQIGAVVLVYVLLASLVFAILKMAKTIEEAKDKLEDVRKDIRELVDNGNKIVEKTNSIVDTVKSSIDGVHETVEITNKRVRLAAADLADRVDDFNNTLSIVQTETQGVVFGALAAFKGVRAGVRAMKGRKRAQPVRPPDELNGDGEVEVPARPRLKRRVRVES